MTVLPHSDMLPSWEKCPPHGWQPHGDFIGGNRTEVICKKCGAPGERDDASGEVYWPAT